MDSLDRSITVTRAYYRAFGWPLTALEVYERLIPGSRLGGTDTAATLGQVMARLPEQDFSNRIEQEKIWADKWRRMRRKAWWLQAVPYVRALCAGGSLALGNVSEKSDWDVFVIAERGHVYTARAGLLLAAWLLRSLRTKHHAIAPDLFCFNHFVTTDGLAIHHRSIYVAHALALLVPIHDPQRYLPRLWQANQWIGDWRSMPVQSSTVRRSVRPSVLLWTVARMGEALLWWVEPLMKNWQQRRIVTDPATTAPGGRVVYTDREIEFHPRSFEMVVLARTNAELQRLGIASPRIHDSGLTG